MAIDLIQTVVDETRYVGNAEIELAAGKRLLIETSPAGDELLDAVVPAGKEWVVDVHVYITEIDA